VEPDHLSLGHGLLLVLEDVVDEEGTTLENLKVMAARATWVVAASTEISPTTQGHRVVPVQNQFSQV
jgi:hypothetical protein